MGGELFWCQGGAKLPLDVDVVNGTTEEPFFLTSLPSAVPNLNAIALDRGDVRVAKVHCLHSEDIYQQCKAGSRKKELTELEKLLNNVHN